MKHILSTLLAVIALSSQAQNPATLTIINSNDIGIPGMQYTYLVDETTSNFNPGNGGAGWTLDLTTLSTDAHDTINVLDISQTSYAAENPQANLLIESSTGTLAAALNTSNSFSIINEIYPLLEGVVDFHYSRPDTVLNYNLVIYNSWSDSSCFSQAMPFGADPGNGIYADSMRVVTGSMETNLVDGEGTCITESGTYTCLRLQTLRTSTDVLEFRQNGVWQYFGIIDQTYTLTYTWWAKTPGFYVAQCEILTETGEVVRVSRLAGTGTTTGLAEQFESESYRPYPNPANEAIIFNTDATGGVIEILDMTGRVVKSANINSTSTQVNVADLADGMYTYRVTTTKVVTGKVQVQH